MSRPASYRIYAQVFSRWPKQDLRPDYQFQDAVRQAVDARFAKYTPAIEADELTKARALQYLEQNRFNDKYKLGPLLSPQSQPTYFADLVQEIEEAPRRSWLERLGKRLSGMIRMS